MAAGIGLQLAVNNYTLTASKALTSCKAPRDVEDVLRNLLLFVRLTTDHIHVEPRSDSSAPATALELSYARVLHETQGTENAAHILKALLFQQMEAITFSLLPVAATSASKSKTVATLLHILFQAAPAAAALQALTSYIGSVTPAAEEEVNTLRPMTQALGTDLAASILAQRFALPSTTGVQQLCTEMGTSQAWTAAPGALPYHYAVAEAMHDQIAAALVSVVERSCQCSQQSLTPQEFIPHVVHQFVATASAASGASHRHSDYSSTSMFETGTRSPNLALPRCAMACMGDVCGRFCRRGFASVVAGTFWQILLKLQQSVHHPQAADPSHNHHQQKDHTHQQQQRQQQQHQQRQQQQHQQQQQQPANRNLQQQEQQVHKPELTHESAASSASSEHHSPGGIGQHAASVIIHAIQDPSAVEKLLSSLLQCASTSLQHLDTNAALLRTVIQPMWAQETVRLLLCTKLLLHTTLPLPSLILLLHLLGALPPQQQPESGAVTQTQNTLVGVTSTLAEVWSDKGFCTRVPLKQQAYITCALAMCLAKTGKGCLERTPGLLPAVLQGVSARLDNPVEAIRRQGMRMGNTFSRALDSQKPLLFGDFPLDILEEEVWHPTARRLAWKNPLTGLTSDLTPEQTSTSTSASSAVNPSIDEESGNESHLKAKSSSSPGPASGWSSDHESDSDDSLQPFDLAEDEDDGLDSGERPMQLRDIAAALRKSEDVNDKLRALKNLEGALLAAPDELKHHAGELAQALLHVRAPDWADEEARSPEDKPQVQRYRSMVALLVSTPEVAGAAFTSELYSPHLDVHQRMLILETLASAAQQMANPRARLPAGRDQMPGVRGALEADSAAVTNATQGSKQLGRTRRWGIKSLQKQQQQQQQQQQQSVARAVPRNAFPGVALPWAAALLQECDVERHGVDLFNRDPLLLGRLLITLGTFVECVGSAPVAAQLAACVLELVRSPGVHGHPQPYVRRSALLASAQVVATLSPARLAGAMTNMPQSGSIDSVLVEQLQWLQGWAADTASSDVDVQCQQLASACRNLQGGLAEQALESLEAGPQNVQQSLPGLPNMQSPAMLIDAVQLGILKL